ncbi:MAG TPA: hypothetical protein VNO50_09860 [Pyrinomonadaceae bacterium]|nr:hypothetical protein [Pyrinomonadaceae bacterium]
MSEELLHRNMRKRLSTRRAVFTVALATAVSLSCGQQGRSLAKSDGPGSAGAVPARVMIVSDKEPGEPLIISGTIYAPDGRTPLEGINLFVYQTDATGVYSTGGNNGDNRDTRIHGVVRSGADGRYEIRTIKPGSYPASRNPAHIHAYVSGPGYPEYWIDEYHFTDDPFVTDEMRAKAGTGNFSSILKLTRGADRVLRGVRDIKVERCTRNCTGR